MTGTKYSYWTEDEDKIIREYYPQGGASNCKDKIKHRTTGAITARASRLGIKRVSSLVKDKLDKVSDHDSYLQKLKEKEIQYIPLTQYINSQTNIDHSCHICNFIWKASPGNILKGRGCPNCASEKSKQHPGGYNNTRFINDQELANSKGICYLVVLVEKETNTRVCLKIGITKGKTNKDVLKRMNGIKGYEARILKTYTGTLKEVFDIEQALHKKWYKYRYIPKISFAGHTECFELHQDIIKTFPFVD